MITAEQERLALSYDPFAGDMDAYEKILSDKMVTARKERPSGACCICFGSIDKGERHRVQTAIVDGDMKECRICEKCCIASAESWDDAGNAIELRTELGMYRAGAMGHEALPTLTESEFFAEKERVAKSSQTKVAAIPAIVIGNRSKTEIDRASDDSARSRAAVERMADMLDDISAPNHHISPKWLGAAAALLVSLVFLYRFLAASHGG